MLHEFIHILHQIMLLHKRKESVEEMKEMGVVFTGRLLVMPYKRTWVVLCVPYL